MTKNLLKRIRIFAYLLGAVLFFFSSRYLGSSSYYLFTIVSAVVFMGVGLLSNLVLISKSKNPNEKNLWKRASIWQVFYLVAVAAYLTYEKSLLRSDGEYLSGVKVLLALWIILTLLSLSLGIGTELVLRKSGEGSRSDPERMRLAQGAWLSIGLLASVLVAFNYVASRWDHVIDLSYLKAGTVSESTKEVVKKAEEPLDVAVFFPSSSEVLPFIKEYLLSAASLNANVRLQFYDKDKNPLEAEEFKVQKNGYVILRLGKKTQRINIGLKLTQAQAGIKALDRNFQKSFIKLISKPKIVYFTRGHGEMSMRGRDKDATRKAARLEKYLKNKNYQIKWLDLASGSTDRVPEDASLVISLAPKTWYRPEEVRALIRYVDNGGSLLAYVEDSTPSVLDAEAIRGDNPFLKFLSSRGIDFVPGPLANDQHFVTATKSKADRWFIFSNVFSNHEVVSQLARHDEKIAVVFFKANSFTVRKHAGKWETFELVRSHQGTYLDSNKNFRMDSPQEKADKFVMGVGARLESDSIASEGRIIAFPAGSLVADPFLPMPGNLVLFAESLDWLMKDSITGGVANVEEDVKIKHTQKEDLVWFYGSTLVSPMIIVLIGFFATRRKRRMRGS